MSKEQNVIVPPPACRGAFAASWIIGWLFTAGFAHLGMWKGILSFVLWPWVLGDALGPS